MTKRTYLYLTSGIEKDTMYFVEYRIKGMTAYMIEKGKNIIIDGDYVKFKKTKVRVHFSKIITFEVKK